MNVIDKYKEVFKNIFFKSGHGPHYEMMTKGMNQELLDQQDQDAINQAIGEVSTGLGEVASTFVQS